VDRYGEPGRLFFYRGPSGTEIELLVPPFNAGAESQGRATVAEFRAMAVNFNGGLVLTRGAIDLEQQVPGVTVLPAGLFTWLSDQHG
jgi:hypothetical protein